MKPWASSQLQSNADLKTLTNFVTQSVTSLTQIANGNILFADNVKCTIVEMVINTTETAVPHNLGVIPGGFIVLNQFAAGVIYSGPSPWNSKFIYLQSSVQVTAKIAVIGG